MKEVIISREDDYRIKITQLDEETALITKEFWDDRLNKWIDYSSKMITKEEYEGLKKFFEGQKK